MANPGDVRRIIRKVVGHPVAGGRVPARLPLALERYAVLFDSIRLPPLPVPVLLVHTGGKPIAYRAAGNRHPGLSVPGLVTFLPRLVRSQAALRGVGEGTLIYFDEGAALPGWLLNSRHLEPVSFTNEVIVAITRRLMHELESGRVGEAYLKVLGNALLAELQRELTRVDTPADPIGSRSHLRIAHTAIQYVQAHLPEPVTVADLARCCGVGVTSFSSSFRLATGSTPHRYLRKARIERSCELLRTTGLSVGEVAGAVGFRGQAHFATAFREERGLTPTAYRNSSRQRTPKRRTAAW